MNLSLQNPTLSQNDNIIKFKQEIGNFIESTIKPIIPETQIPAYTKFMEKGGFGATYISDDGKYAIKVVDYKRYFSHIISNVTLAKSLSSIKTQLQNEIINYYDISQKCPEYFCKFVGYNYNIDECIIHIIMDYCGHDLFHIYQYESSRITKAINNAYKNKPYNYQKNMFQNEMKNRFLPIFYQIANAMQCLHTNNYVHFDIKPDNIVVSPDNNVKFIDAGSLTYINNMGKPTLVYGSIDYMAPELHNKSLISNTLKLFKTDIYSYGKMMERMNINIFNPKIMAQLMASNPEDRPSVEDIINEFQNPQNVNDDQEEHQNPVKRISSVEQYLGGKKRTKRRRKQRRSKRRRETPFAKE